MEINTCVIVKNCEMLKKSKFLNIFRKQCLKPDDILLLMEMCRHGVISAVKSPQ